MNEKSIQDLFYPSHLSTPVRPLPDFSKIYRELTDRSHRTNFILYLASLQKRSS